MKVPRVRAPSRSVPALAALVLAACGGGVTVRNVRGGGPPRPADCELEVLRTAPGRPHDALADLESHVTRVPPGGALSVVMPAACRLGADAIVVTRDMVLNELGHTFVAVTAIRYRSPAPGPADAPAGEADGAR